MHISSLSKALIPIAVTFAAVEIGSRIVAYQPITTTWRELHANGVATNISNSTGLHEFWANGIKIYKFGNFANRISLASSNKLSPSAKTLPKNSCKYLILGDSFSFGWLVEYEETFPSRIEKHLSQIPNMDNKVHFINAAAGGWGLADYHGYLEIYKQKLKDLGLKGVIVFINSDDGNRAADSHLYSTSKGDEDIAIKRSNRSFTSQSGKVKRFLNHPFIAPIYNASQKHSNIARIIKNLFLNKQISINPQRNSIINSSDTPKAGLGEELTESSLTKVQKLKIDRSIFDLSQESSDLAPLMMVYTGVTPIDRMKPTNRYLFSDEFRSNIISKGISIDFSTLPSMSLYGNDSQVKYDGHPNALGHKHIADHILGSKSHNSLVKFIKSTCSA